MAMRGASRCIAVVALLVLAATGARPAAADSGDSTSEPPEAAAGFSAAEGDKCDGGAPPEPLVPQLHDLTVQLEHGLVVWESDSGLPNDFKWLAADMRQGDPYFATQLSELNVHTGTHVDAPAHYLLDEWNAGNTVEKLDLDVLMGPALVVQVPSDTNITAEVLRSLGLPRSLTRLLFKTANTERQLLKSSMFVSDFVGMTEDGAQYLVEHTQIKLVGIDYLSIASMDHLAPGHEVLLRQHVIPVEGLDLTYLHAGQWYQLTCLPLLIQGADGAPTRCVAYGPANLELGDHDYTDLSQLSDEAWPEEGIQL